MIRKIHQFYYLIVIILLASCAGADSLDCFGNQKLQKLEIGNEALSFLNVALQNKSNIILKNEAGEQLKLQIDTKPLAGSRQFLDIEKDLRKTLECSDKSSFEVVYDAEIFELGLFEPEKGFFIIIQINPLFEFINGSRFNFYDYISVSYNGSGGPTETMIFSNKNQETIQPILTTTKKVETITINGKQFKEVYINERPALPPALLLNKNQGVVGINYNNQWWNFERLE